MKWTDKFKTPEEIRKFLDSGEFAEGFKTWLVTSIAHSPDVSQYLDALTKRLQHVLGVASPFIIHVISEFEKWRYSSETLFEAGWLPHYSTPFKHLTICGKDIELVHNQLLDYYKGNWRSVRITIESHLSDYSIDLEAKATFREALDAHEAGFYRCVCRVLFPEVERVIREELLNCKFGRFGYQEYVRELINRSKSIDAFVHNGLYELSIFEHVMQTLLMKEREQDKPESNDLVFGVFRNVDNEKHLEILKKHPIPNRHAAIHGLVEYSTMQSSLNSIFIAEYVFRSVSSMKNCNDSLTGNS